MGSVKAIRVSSKSDLLPVFFGIYRMNEKVLFSPELLFNLFSSLVSSTVSLSLLNCKVNLVWKM